MPASRFADLLRMVFGPLEGRDESTWHRAPPGKWTPAQIVHHLAVGVDGTSRAFESRAGKPPMSRRPLGPTERLAWVVILGLHWFPPGRRAPPQSLPSERPDPRAVSRLLQDGVERFLALEQSLLPARARDLFVKHPALGDLTLEEWMRFHVIHARHHAKQILERLKYVEP